jgi:molecular chaperone GrpE
LKSHEKNEESAENKQEKAQTDNLDKHESIKNVERNEKINNDNTSNNNRNNEKSKIDELEEMRATLQRLQAEFENYQKRAQRDSENFRTMANASLIEDLLPVLDTLEQGSIHNKEFVVVKEQLEKVLRKKGLEKIIVKRGTDFDHDKMDCLMDEECAETKEGNVVNVLINGYTLNGRILRPAKVSIAKAKSNGVENKNHGSES